MSGSEVTTLWHYTNTHTHTRQCTQGKNTNTFIVVVFVVERWGTCVVICLERDADLHMAQLIPLPLTVSCFSKIPIGFTFLVPAHQGSAGKRAVKRVCVLLLLLLPMMCPTVCGVVGLAVYIVSSRVARVQYWRRPWNIFTVCVETSRR